MVDIFTPIFICVVMPVMIVWLVMRAKQKQTDKMAEIILKAIESGTPINPDFLINHPLRKSIKERLLGLLTASVILMALGLGFVLIGIIIIIACHWNLRTAPSGFTLLLFGGGILLVVGFSLLVVYLIRKRVLSKEIENEEKALDTSSKQ
ncbi:MAG: hypothetical protein J6N54_01315 [Bacteroidales bacterium]|nr:hypothetical protein [Bacteroidales bacterium]